MNSDPHETAAWRAFGMLDADEASAFDEASRLDPELKKVVADINVMTAAVAVVSSAPVRLRSGELDRLRARLGFPGHHQNQILAWSGWAAAAVLTVLLVITKQPAGSSTDLVQTSELGVVPPAVMHPDTAATVELVEPPAVTQTEVTQIAGSEGNTVRVETKRLIQEIDVLRGQLANFQKRDRERFSPIPGVSWPIVMTMRPPGTLAEVDPAASSLNNVLGDALAGRESLVGGKFSNTFTDPETGTEFPVLDPPGIMESVAPVPTAIPIYDSARDAGTLVVGNLPSLEVNEAYNLWVKTSSEANPVHVGRLPETGAAGADALDFSLGSTGIVPSAFILTRDNDGAPLAPGSNNTILLGP